MDLLNQEHDELEKLLRVISESRHDLKSKRQEALMSADLEEQQMKLHRIISTLKQNQANMSPEEWDSTQATLAVIKENLRHISEKRGVFHASGALMSRELVWTAAPSDKTTANLIQGIATKTGAFQIGPDVEARLRQRYIGDVRYDFLYEGNPGNEYYKWCQHCAKHDQDPHVNPNEDEVVMSGGRHIICNSIQRKVVLDQPVDHVPRPPFPPPLPFVGHGRGVASE